MPRPRVLNSERQSRALVSTGSAVMPFSHWPPPSMPILEDLVLGDLGVVALVLDQVHAKDRYFRS